MTGRWCSRCRTERPIEWSADAAFGPRAESARCPVCGTVWGVRDRRPSAYTAGEGAPARREAESRPGAFGALWPAP
jgi:hypothetical protein